MIADSRHFPTEERVTADFLYVRFHGPGSLYASNYDEAELYSWSKKIIAWNKNNLDVYAYFNNDYLGYAVKNAALLKRYVKL